MTAPKALRELGYQHASSAWWAAPDPETTPELQWPKSVAVYDTMRRQDAQVMSVLRAVWLPVRRTNWWLDPAGARPDVVAQIAEDLGLPIRGQDPAIDPEFVRSRDRFSWSEHLRLALLMLPFGHSFFEQVYRFDPGSGFYRLRKLGWRPPRTISKIDVAADGGLVAIEQSGGLAKKDARIPVDQLVAYVHEREGGNWLGQSLLRPAYKFWLLKDRALRVQSQAIERNGMGIPLYKASPIAEGVDTEEARQRETEELEAGRQMASAWRVGDNSGGAVPNGADMILRGVEGRIPDADPVIRYYDEQIARAVLAHFLNLGTETGSWALGSTFADFFTLSLQTLAQDIADVATQHIVEDLVDINWGSGERAPRIVHDEIGARHPATAEALYQLVSCGALTVDDNTETWIRNTYGLPALTGTRPDPSSTEG
ncbi:hypothetical protein CGZ93_17865 [Enemella dayhoffiae]|uniref:Portal protein n=1 Tax=Enemella dayhoffiae TaxID=2016507 RepID=A0A255GLB1_9ACTN|nr:hypothetical protein [Enemella dayhoffiae]OYO16627.1 hypothetical protein CGZ93_17865 [Enemella dayhoffiae]